MGLAAGYWATSSLPPSVASFAVEPKSSVEGAELTGWHERPHHTLLPGGIQPVNLGLDAEAEGVEAEALG
jgi:hypothetical protein